MINYQDFSYNGSKVTFSRSDNAVMINATEMSRPFGDHKRPSKWLDNDSSKELLKAVAKARKRPLDSLVIIKRGGNNPSTWMHEDVALMFAQWLSPDFYVWCNDHIKELLMTGKTEIAHTKEDAEMIGFAKACIDTDIRWSFRRVANRIITNDGAHLSRKQLIFWLRDNGYLCDSDDVKECPTQWAIDMGYMMIQHPSVLERKDRAMKKRMSKGYPTPLGAMHLINLLTRSLPKGRGRVAEQKQLDL